MADSLRILITDEDLDSRVNTRKALQRAQLGVAGETGYGTEAVSLAVESRPDAILVAVEEPTGRALDTAEALSNALPDTPIIIYSTLEDAESLRRGMVFGARDYLVKPVQATRLRSAITQALEQEERRQMRRAGQLVSVEARGTVITVTGAKGGIGKSVLAVNLAVALRSQTGKSVAVLDADTQFGDVATMLDLTPTVTVTNVIKHLDEMDRQNVREFVTPHASGVEVMAAPREEDSWGRIDQEGLKKIIDLLAQLYEFVIIDTSGSFDGFVRTCVEASTLALVVTTLEVSSVRDTALALRRLKAWGIDDDRTRIVLNRGARAGGISTGELTKAIQREVYWQIPYDKRMPASVQLGTPVAADARKSPAAESVRDLARRIAGTSKSLINEPPAVPAWRRLLQFRGNQHDTTVAPAPEPNSQR